VEQATKLGNLELLGIMAGATFLFLIVKSQSDTELACLGDADVKQLKLM